MATAPDRQCHSQRGRRISRSALGLQRHLPHQHRAGLRLSRPPTRPGRSISLQRDRDTDAHLLMKKKTLNAQRSTFNIEWTRVREDEARYDFDKRHVSKARFDLEDRLLEF